MKTLPNPQKLRTLGWGGLYQCYQQSEVLKSLFTIQVAYKTPQYWAEEARKLQKTNGGRMPPHRTWPCGMKGAYEYHPDLFSFMKLHNNFKTPQYWAVEARKLQKKNSGRMPPIAIWPSGMRTAYYKYAELFEFIQLHNTWKTPQEWVIEARKLQKTNGGRMPAITMWPIGMSRAYHTYPELFKFIKLHNTWKTPEEWASEAYKMQKKNSGKMPPYAQWPSGMAAARKNNPELFKGIRLKTEGLRKTPQEWAIEAHRLQKKGGGRMPPIHTWPQGMVHAYYLHPKLFNFVALHNTRKTPQHWAAEARKLQRQNGGRMPPVTQWPCMIKTTRLLRPELFKGIKLHSE